MTRPTSGKSPAEYLEAFRASEKPSPQRLDTVLGRIERATLSGPTPSGPGASGLVTKSLLAVAVIGAAVAMLINPGEAETSPPAAAAPPAEVPVVRTDPPVVRTDPSAPSMRPPHTVVVMEPADAPELDPTAPRSRAVHDRDAERPRGRRRAKAAAPPAPPPIAPPGLGRDVALMKEIRADIVGGRHSAALTKITEHREVFPSSVLSHERTVLEAEAMCGVGRHARGRSVADEFLRRYPRSALAARARKACADPSGLTDVR